MADNQSQEHSEHARNQTELSKQIPRQKSRRALLICGLIGLFLGLLRGLPVLAKTGLGDPEQLGEVIGFGIGLALTGMAVGWLIDRAAVAPITELSTRSSKL